EDRFWPDGALGQRINLSSPTKPPDLYEIVGVVGHVQYERLDEDGRFQLYFPVAQRPWWNELEYTLHARGDAAALLPGARAEVARLSPDLAVHSMRTLETVVSETLAFRGLQTALLGAFGLVALSLSAVGIYSMLSHSVTERRREVGVRMALGASRGKILKLVLREGILLFASGIALGAMATLGVSQLVARFLFGVEPTDAVTYLLVTAVLASVALAAALVPALRASRTDPLSALRAD
ncbi:MAG: FtsX-like permease family protein, partial [Vicinamibacteria bacterium]